MKTFLSDIFPKIQRYSEKLDNLTLLTNQHWVFIDDIMSNKTVYIFRSNNELLVSQNGKVEKAKWEYLGNQSLLIDIEPNSYLFKHGFFDENVLALKIDSKEEYAIFVNENKYDGELNSIDRVSDFLKQKYLSSSIRDTIENVVANKISKSNGPTEPTKIVYTDKGIIQIELEFGIPSLNNKVFQNNLPAKDGKYKLGFMNNILVKDGIIVGLPYF